MESTGSNHNINSSNSNSNSTINTIDDINKLHHENQRLQRYIIELQQQLRQYEPEQVQVQGQGQGQSTNHMKLEILGDNDSSNSVKDKDIDNDNHDEEAEADVHDSDSGSHKEKKHNELGERVTGDGSGRDSRRSLCSMLKDIYFPSHQPVAFATPAEWWGKIVDTPIRGQDRPASLFYALWSSMTAFIAISIITSWSSYFGEGRDFRFAFAYNGASAALIYCMPNSPAGTPKNMFVGHTIAGITTVTITYCIFGAGGWTWLAASLSVSFSILFMQLCGCVNPPAAAASLVYALSTQDGDVQEYAFLYVGCVIVGATIMVIIGVIFDNIPKNQRYPVSWI